MHMIYRWRSLAHHLHSCPPQAWWQPATGVAAVRGGCARSARVQSRRRTTYRVRDRCAPRAPWPAAGRAGCPCRIGTTAAGGRSRHTDATTKFSIQQFKLYFEVLNLNLVSRCRYSGLLKLVPKFSSRSESRSALRPADAISKMHRTARATVFIISQGTQLHTASNSVAKGHRSHFPFHLITY
eukprot:SAG31_NODE_201_length_20535_cov_15.315081_19_plen_183_part_00